MDDSCQLCPSRGDPHLTIMSYDIYLRQIVHGDLKPIHIILGKQAITVGGNEFSELKRLSKVSHPHAYIVSQQGQWFVKDLNSSFGTYVNRYRIGTDLHPLQIGDQIGLGAAECNEDGFVCALCMKPKLRKIKKEPLDFIDISEDPPDVKTEPDDDYEVSYIPKPNNIPETNPKKTYKTKDFGQSNKKVSNSALSKNSEIKDLLQPKIKTFSRTTPRDDRSITADPQTKIAEHILKTEPQFSSSENSKTAFVKESSSADEKCNLPSLYFTNVEAHSNTKNSCDSFSVDKYSSSNTCLTITNQPIESRNLQNLRYSSNVSDLPRLDKRSETDANISNSTDLSSFTSLHKKCLRLDLSTKSGSRNSTQEKVLISNPQINTLSIKNISKSDTSCSDKTVSRKRLCLGLTKDHQRITCKFDKNQATGYENTLVSESENLCSKEQHEVIQPCLGFDDSKVLKENMKYSDSVYSSDVSALLKHVATDVEKGMDSSYVKNNIERENRASITSSNDNPFFNFQSFPGVKPEKDVNKSDLLSRNVKEEIFSELVLDMNRIPEQSKICTNFLVPYVSVDKHLNCNKMFAESQNGTYGKNVLSSLTTLSSSKKVATAENVSLKKTILASNYFNEESSKGTCYDLKPPENTVPCAFQDPKVYNALNFLNKVKDNDMCATVTENSKWPNNSAPLSFTSKGNFHANVFPITEPKLSILSSISSSVLKDVLTLTKKVIPVTSVDSVFKNNTVIPFISNDSSTVNSDQIHSKKILETNISTSPKRPSEDVRCTSYVNRMQISENGDTLSSTLAFKNKSSTSSVSSSRKKLFQNRTDKLMKTDIPAPFKTMNPPSNSDSFHPPVPEKNISKAKVSASYKCLDSSQKFNLFNNWIPVPLIEENASCVSLLPKCESSSNVTPTTVLKFENEVVSAPPSNQEKGSRKNVDEDNCHKSSSLILDYVSEITNTTATTTKESLFSNPNLSTYYNKLLETNVSTSLDSPETLNMLYPNTKWVNNWYPITSSDNTTSSPNSKSLNNQLSIVSSDGDTTSPNSKCVNDWFPVISSDDDTSSPNSKYVYNWFPVTLSDDDASCVSIFETSRVLSSSKQLSSSYLPLLITDSKEKVQKETTSHSSKVPGSMNVFGGSKYTPLNDLHASTEKVTFPTCNLTMNEVKSENPSTSSICISKILTKEIENFKYHVLESIRNKDNLNSCLESKSLVNFIKNVVEFDVNYLEKKNHDGKPPPLLLKDVVYLPLRFSTVEQYVSSFIPLLVLEVWQNVYERSKQIWKDNTYNLFYFTVLSYNRRSNFNEYHCEAVVNQSTFEPAKGNVVLMEIQAENNAHYKSCFYVSQHSIVEQTNSLLNPHLNKESKIQMRDSKLWRFSVIAKPHSNPPILNQLMKGNGIVSVQRYICLVDGLEHLASSPLNKTILEPDLHSFCEPSKLARKLSQSEAVSQISSKIQNDSLVPRILLLQGVPGTGKTQIIVNLIERLLTEDPKARILVTCASDSGLDDIGHRFSSRVKKVTIRLGASKELDYLCFNSKVSKYVKGQQKKLKKQILNLNIENKFSNFKKKQDTVTNTKKRIKENLQNVDYHILMTAKIVLSTLSDCRTLSSDILHKHVFSCCIVDDATRSTELEILQCMVADTKKLLLIGDPHQILTKGCSSLSASYGFERSMFARFSNYFHRHQKKELIIELKEQWRMHSEIWQFPSKQFFNNSFPSVRNDNWPHSKRFRHLYFVYDVLNQSFPPIFDELIFQICSHLRFIKKTAASIGIIIPRPDIRSYYIEHILKNDSAYNHIEVGSIDAFLGKEKDIIILAGGQSELANVPSFLTCKRSLIVALTRASNCLIVCTASNALKCIPEWQCLIDDAKNRKVYKTLYSGKNIHAIVKETIAGQPKPQKLK